MLYITILYYIFNFKLFFYIFSYIFFIFFHIYIWSLSLSLSYSLSLSHALFSPREFPANLSFFFSYYSAGIEPWILVIQVALYPVGNFAILIMCSNCIYIVVKVLALWDGNFQFWRIEPESASTFFFFFFFIFFVIKLSRYGCMVDYEMGHNFASRDGHMFNHERGNNFHLVTVTWSKTREGTIFCYKYIFHHGRNAIPPHFVRGIAILLQIHFRTVKSRVLVILRNNTSVFHQRDVTFFPEHFPRNICHVLSCQILRWGRPLQCWTSCWFYRVVRCDDNSSPLHLRSERSPWRTYLHR